MGNLFGLSEQQRVFRRTSSCPICGKFMIGGAAMTGPAGEAVSPLTPYPLIPKGTVAACRSGDHSWPIFAGDDVRQSPSEWTFVRTEGITRHDSPLGKDVREIDNSESGVSATRTFDVTREWTRTLEVESERTTTLSAGLSISPLDIVTIELGAERSLRERYGITGEERRSVNETVEVEVPGGRRVALTLEWKQIIESGMAIFRRSDGAEVGVPFELVVEVTFDQRMKDVGS